MQFVQIPRVEPTEATAMEINNCQTSLAATHTRPTPALDNLQIITHKETSPPIAKTNEIVELSKNEKIKLLVKEHDSIRDKFLRAQAVNNIPEMKTLLFKAQESQKSLPKLIPNKEVESYVQGWNPWEIKKQLYPLRNAREKASQNH